MVTMDQRKLRADEPLAIELTAALKRGDTARLEELLAAEPGFPSVGAADRVSLDGRNSVQP